MSYVLETKLAHTSNYSADEHKKSYIVIHYTANDGDSAWANANYFQGARRYASAHYFVDDNKVTISVPDTQTAWAVGGQKYRDCNVTGGGKYFGKVNNNNSISIELCDTVKNGVVKATQATINNAIELTKRLMRKHNIPQERVLRHFDVNGKHCPAYWMDDATWKRECWNKLTPMATATHNTGNKVTSTKNQDTKAVNSNAFYQVRTEGDKGYPEVLNRRDYAGVEGRKITKVAVKTDKGVIHYQVHVLGGGWLPYVTGYDFSEHENGYAGNGRVIDGFRAYSSYGIGELKYRVSITSSKDYLPTVTEATNYAGILGKPIDKIQIWFE